MNERAIKLLAEYLAGDLVGHQSMCRALPEGRMDMAREKADAFFHLRSAFNIIGWADTDEAARCIRLTLSGGGES